jgi:N-acetylmuramoyl-L-alanine amidase
MNITHIVVHYSATYSDQNITRADIDKMHKARGWKMIGYHWFIRRDGTVEQGRPETMVGAHVANQNTGKIGICWAGGLERATGPNKGVNNMTEAQERALIEKIRECLKRYPKAIVTGHRNLASTQCPGFDVPAWWARVQKKKVPGETVVPVSAPVKTPGVAEDEFHKVEKGETWWGIAKMYDIPLVALLSMNDATDKDKLVIGRKLRVRRAPEPKEEPKPVETQKPMTILAWLLSLFTKEK